MCSVTDDVVFFNCSAPEVRVETNGILLPRVPDKVRHALSPRGRFVSMASTGVEIRFVTQAPIVRIMLSTLDDQAHITVYRGEHELSDHALKQGVLETIHLEAVNLGIQQVHPDILADSAFSPDVWRVVIRNGTVYYHGLDALGESVRPPCPAQVPAICWLAYGSSITNATAKGYPHHAARDLGVDVLNQGMSGA